MAKHCLLSLAFQIVRCMGQLLVGNMFAVVVTIGTPNAKDLGVDLSMVAAAIAPAATAVGQCSFKF